MKSIKVDDLHDVETRKTDAGTGGQKGSKLTQLGALDPIALIYLARVAGYGADKYAAFNFLKGYDWSLTQNAGQRHNLLFWAGEDIDEESGLPHPALEAWHALTKLSFYLRGLGTDDRPPRLPSVADVGKSNDPVTGEPQADSIGDALREFDRDWKTMLVPPCIDCPGRDLGMHLLSCPRREAKPFA